MSKSLDSSVNGGFDAMLTANLVLADQSVGADPCIRYWNREWYRWDGCSYAKVSADEIKKRILAHLRANQPPAMADPSGALARRMIVLKTGRSWAGKEDMTLTQKLVAELPGILQWAIGGWRRLHQRGHFRQPRSSQHLVEHYQGSPDVKGTNSAFRSKVAALRTGRPVELEPFGEIGISVGHDAINITIRKERSRR
jgi:hypothetical protein